MDGLENLRPEQLAGEHLDDVRTRLHAGHHLGDAHGAGHAGHAVAVAQADGVAVEVGADHILGAGEDGHAGGLGVHDGARADDKVGAVILSGHLLNDGVDAGGGVGQLDAGAAALDAGLGDAHGVVGVLGADHGHQAAGAKLGKYLFLFHGKNLLTHSCGTPYTRRRAAWPCSTPQMPPSPGRRRPRLRGRAPPCG